MTRSSSTRLLFLAAFVIVFALAFAPLSFAGEDDPGPTQAAETVATAPVTPAAPAAPTAPTTTSSTTSSSSSSSTSKSKDTVRAKGGVQTGLGGMAAGSGSSMLVALALGGGGLVLLTAASGVAPLRRRSEG
jgi:hypothetical protein